jgi:organic radical activating enzyme
MSNNEYQTHLDNTKNQLDQVSPTFCVAKWKQVTMHLQNGMNHSCHHPKTHIVPISEIKSNPKSLHNSEYKKQQRKLMLEGKRPEECDYCWRVEDSNNRSEDNTQNVFSDRIYKSADQWAFPFIEDIRSKPWDDNIDPSYVEVSFSNVCNFKCSYCAPHISSQWLEEIERYGAYPTSTNFNNIEWLKLQKMMPIPNREENPYVDAFWAWWPTMYNNLKQFRITGGEPLLSKNTFQVLDYIIDNPNPNLQVSINTNMNPPDELFDKFLEKVKIIINEKKLKKFKLFTSAEAHGKQSEYIRFGMNYDKWLSNIHKVYKEIPSIEFTIMSTYNILSLTSYIKFLDDVLDIKRQYGSHSSPRNPMLLDIPYLRHPEHQAVFLLEPEMLPMLYDQVTHVYRNLEYKNWYDTANRGFYEYEADKLKRIYNIAKENIFNEWTNINRSNFIKFVDEHDRRRGTNFLETFPEFEHVYSKWKTL